MAISDRRTQTDLSGPWGWENARAQQAGRPPLGALEIACYTDVYGLDSDIEETSGPYTLITPLSTYDVISRGLGSPRMNLVLRAEQYLERPNDYYLDEKWDQRDARVYHGGDAGQELAALVSLALGVRVRAAGISRIFAPPDEVRGRPHEPDPPPYLPQPGAFSMLPYTLGKKILSLDPSNIRLLDLYPNMTDPQARALVKAARAYQEAIWIADGDPQQAWLRLVTAIETVSQLIPSQSASRRLEAIDPELAHRLSLVGDAELTELITIKLADQGRSTAKFLDFLDRFRPPRPPRRPTHGKLNWKNIQTQFKDIYTYRSKNLHQGIPFPEAMCQAPFLSQSGLAPEITDVPVKGNYKMRLHIFEYAVRYALLAWWKSTSE